MEFNILNFKNVFIESFKEIHKRIDTKNDYLGSLISSDFIYELSKNIQSKFFPQSELNSIKDKSERQGYGEWLFDMCITNSISLENEKKTKIYNKIIFALECEWCSGIYDFAKDFGKILCCNAKHRVFISGLTQIEEKYRKKHIEKLLEALEPLENHLNDIILVFCPSPLIIGNGKNGKKSLWNWEPNNIDKLTKMIFIYEYNQHKKWENKNIISL